MKKIILAAIMAVAGISLAMAQPRAIGVNLGYGASFSYQHNIGASNMIDLAVDAPLFHGIGASATYDWIDPFNAPVPWDEQGEWHWYMGVGAGAGFYFGQEQTPGQIFAGVVGHVGIGYDFWFPLALSLDYRPNFGVGISDGDIHFNGTGLITGISLGVRYKF